MSHSLKLPYSYTELIFSSSILQNELTNLCFFFSLSFFDFGSTARGVEVFRVILGSVLKDHVWQCLGNHTWYLLGIKLGVGRMQAKSLNPYTISPVQSMLFKSGKRSHGAQAMYLKKKKQACKQSPTMSTKWNTPKLKQSPQLFFLWDIGLGRRWEKGAMSKLSPALPSLGRSWVSQVVCFSSGQKNVVAMKRVWGGLVSLAHSRDSQVKVARTHWKKPHSWENVRVLPSPRYNINISNTIQTWPIALQRPNHSQGKSRFWLSLKGFEK